MTAQRIAYGTVSSAGSDVVVYTVPRHSRAIIASLVMTNVSQNDDVEVSVKVSVGSGIFRVLPDGLVIRARDSFHLITPISIEQNERLSIQVSIASSIEYYVTAYFETAIATPTDRAE